MDKYFGGFSDVEDIKREFFPPNYNYSTREYIPVEVDDLFPTEEEIIFASYEGGSYEGDAHIIFQKDGKLYEVNGSHCSCNGLEGQWNPEETSWEAIKMRPSNNYSTYGLHSSAYDTKTRQTYKELVEKNVQ